MADQTGDLDFQEMMNDDVLLIVPSVYAKFHLLNHCIYLRTFQKYQEQLGSSTLERRIFEDKLQQVKDILGGLVHVDNIGSNCQDE